MDFIFNHGDFFISVGVIMLLAVIGYYADRNESKKKFSTSSSSLDKKSIGKQCVSSDDVNDIDVAATASDANENINNYDLSNDTFVNDDVELGSSNDDVKNIVDLDETSSNQFGLESSVTVKPDLDFSSFTESDYENINMSLQDLENKKNVDSKSLNVYDGSFSNHVVTNDISNEYDQINSPGFDVVDCESDYIKENNNYDDESDLMNYGFDSEVETINSDSISDQLDSDEIIDSGSDLSGENMSSDDDIWKF